MSVPDSLYRRGGRLVWRFMRAHPGPFALSVVGAVLFSAAAVSVPLVIGRVTDSLISPAFHEGVTSSEVIAGVAVVMGVGLVRGLSIIMRRYFAAMVEARMQVTLRTDVAEKYLTVPMTYYQANPTGELLAHSDADVVGTTTSIKPLPFSIGVIALVVFALISLYLVDWTFAVVALILFPALTLLNRRYTAQVHAPITEVQERLGNISSIAHESFDGALVVKTLGLEAAEAERFAVEAEQLRLADLTAGRIRAGFDPILDALPSLGTLLLFVVGGVRIADGAVTAGDLVQAALLFSILAFPMRVFGFFLQEMPRAVVSIDRIDEVLDTPDEPGAAPPPLTLPAGPLGVAMHDVHFAYEDDLVLAGVSFEVRPGETVALVGPTGAGKSTLTSLLVRLTEADTGAVEVGGVDVRRVDPDELRSNVGLVFQESFLFAASVHDNIALEDGAADDHGAPDDGAPDDGAPDDGAPDERASDDGAADARADVVAEAAKVAQVARFVDRLPNGWDTIVGERGVTLSGGQRQRVALARALAMGPRVLVLDDATAAVDPVVEAQILDGLRRQGDTTLIVVAHRLSTIRLADRVLFLDDGRVGGIGTHDELLATLPGYEALVRAYEQDDLGDEEVA